MRGACRIGPEELELICPDCRAEYRPGFTVCSDCDVALIDETALPAAADSEAAGESALALEPFHETWSSDELGALLESLEEGGVAYVVQAGTALSLLTSATGSGEFPEEWHARILVVGAHLGKAKEILRELRRLATAGRSAATARPPV